MSGKESVRPIIGFTSLIESQQRASRPTPQWELEAEKKEEERKRSELLSFRKKALSIINKFQSEADGNGKTTLAAPVSDDSGDEWQVRLRMHPVKMRVETLTLEYFTQNETWSPIFQASYSISRMIKGGSSAASPLLAITPESKRKGMDAGTGEVIQANQSLLLLEKGLQQQKS